MAFSLLWWGRQVLGFNQLWISMEYHQRRVIIDAPPRNVFIIIQNYCGDIVGQGLRT